MQRCKEWGHDTTATGIYLFWMLDNEVSGQVIEPTKWGMVQASGGTTTMKGKEKPGQNPSMSCTWVHAAKSGFEEPNRTSIPSCTREDTFPNCAWSTQCCAA